MKRTRQKVLSVLIILTVAFIWGNSLLPPQSSWAVSDAVQEFLSRFSVVGTPETGGVFWGTIIRKLAHYTEFTVLGCLLQFRLREKYSGRWIGVLSGVLTAMSDESIQYFTGRTSSVLDVWLDTLGVISGLLIYLGFNAVKNASGEKR